MMFATLLGGLPHPTLPTADERELDELVRVAIRAQEDAGLEPITDGRLRDPGFERLAAALTSGRADDATRALRAVVRAWTDAAGMTDRAVKHVLPGPYSVAWRLAPGGQDRAPGWHARTTATLSVAEALALAIDALAEAGCPLIEIEETQAHRIGTDEAERRLFRDAHQRLTAGGLGGEIHRSLSIVGPSADSAGPETILDAPYSSFAFDLIAGPDNWNLVTRVPGDRGVVAGVLSPRETDDEPKEVMLWAAHRVASSGRRGMDRVGLGSAGSFANLAWGTAVEKIRKLGEASRLASMPPSEELARSLDPRSVSSRRAAMGHGAPRPRRRRRS